MDSVIGSEIGFMGLRELWKSYIPALQLYHNAFFVTWILLALNQTFG